MTRLSTETVKGTAGALEGVDNVESGDGLPLCVFSIGHRVANDLQNMLESKIKLVKVVTDIFKESFENTTSLFVDQTRDTLDTSTASKTANGGLGDTLDVITKNLPVTLGSSLSESLIVL